MRKIEAQNITNLVKELALDANCNLGTSFMDLLREKIKLEKSNIGKNVLEQIVENDEIAKNEGAPMCQDTGLVVCFAEVGYDVHIIGDLYEAINQGVREAYDEGFFRKSVVDNPFTRKNTGDNTPAITHVKLVPGDQIKITLAPKGGGSENMSLVKMLTPAEGIEGIKKLVLHTIFYAGGKPCPPLIVGIGVGGNLEKSALLAKEAILREVDDINPDLYLRKLEEEILDDINKLGVGPMGFGGSTTALAVKINTYPCHIASLPVAINLQCHASRHKTGVI
ncbi:fumarate hydratase [Mariniplasma anaerobium]|uniref:Fumarate hydratase n=1 Tax=Mariniplasma anaerobium TaxID=2735436 RepID=A0A7U9XWH6_9MOLU|nr:fumarate hydratase [Mariniplasma anaerobium]BCR35268.1 fumarate hydratase [Mariniplasma anaerobium]